MSEQSTKLLPTVIENRSASCLVELVDTENDNSEKHTIATTTTTTTKQLYLVSPYLYMVLPYNKKTNIFSKRQGNNFPFQGHSIHRALSCSIYEYSQQWESPIYNGLNDECLLMSIFLFKGTLFTVRFLALSTNIVNNESRGFAMENDECLLMSILYPSCRNEQYSLY